MARRRMIEVSIAYDETFNDLSEWAQLLFLRMLPHTDDAGRLAGAPRTVKARCNPMSERPLEEFAAGIAEIIKVGLLDVYTTTTGAIVLQFKSKSFRRINAVLVKNSRGASEYADPEQEISLTSEEYLACVARDRHVAVSCRPRHIESKRQKVESREESEEGSQGGAAITFALNTGAEFAVTEEQASEFQRLYPNVDVRQELREIRAWCIANPKRRKTAAGALKFVNSWLGTQQDRASPAPLPSRAQATPARSAYLTHEQMLAQCRVESDWERYDRWRHLPSGLIRYFPRGTAPADTSEYERFTP